MMFENEDAGNPAEQPHPAADGKIDLSREKNQQHPERESGGER